MIRESCGTDRTAAGPSVARRCGYGEIVYERVAPGSAGNEVRSPIAWSRIPWPHGSKRADGRHRFQGCSVTRLSRHALLISCVMKFVHLITQCECSRL